MVISEVMNRSVISCSPDESAAHAARLMRQYNVGSLPVCSSDGKLRGVLTDRDLVLRCMAEGSDPSKTPVREIMTRCIVTAEPEEEIEAVAGKMGNEQIRRVPVVRYGKVVGIVSLGDLAQRRSCDMEAAKALCDISANVRKK